MNRLKSFSLFLLVISQVTNSFCQYHNSPNIADRYFNVKDFGAVGDGVNIATEPIQRALKMTGKKGGRLIIPPGIYLCGPLQIESNTELILDSGATLRLINNIEQYPVVNNQYQNFLDCGSSSNIKISGKGIIDGQGKIWWDSYDAKKLIYRRPQLLFSQQGSLIEISGVTFLNPPNTHLSLKDVTDVHIHHIKLISPTKSHNTDGINISAINCTIEDCDISTGDDNIAFNFGTRRKDGQPECENLLVQNCRFGDGHGLSIGSYTTGGLRNLTVKNCRFEGTTSGIRIKSAKGRGGIVENLTYQDITMKNVRYPIAITAYYPKEPVTPNIDTVTIAGDKDPLYKSITIKNVVITGADNGIRIWGTPGSSIDNVQFENTRISSKEGSFIYNATDVSFKNCTITNQKGDLLKTYWADVKGFK